MFSYVQSSMPVEGLAEEVKPVLTETSSSGLFSPSLGLGASYRVASHVMLGASIRGSRCLHDDYHGGRLSQRPDRVCPGSRPALRSGHVRLRLYNVVDGR